MSKSRSERGGKGTPVAAQNVPQVQVSNAIVPGKFMDTDWNRLIEDESSEDFISIIIEEVLSHSCDIIYSKIIELRVQPYTVSTARKMLLDIIEWQFLHCDNGEQSDGTDSTWMEDEEADAHITDSWAQGAVPFFAGEVESIIEEEEEEENKEEDAAQVDMTSDIPVCDANNNALDEESDIVNTDEAMTVDMSIDMSAQVRPEPSGRESADNDESDEEGSVLLPRPPSLTATEMSLPRRVKFKKYFGKLPDFHSATSTPVNDDRPRHRHHAPHTKKVVMRIGDMSHFSIKMQQKVEKDVVFDEKGYAVHIPRLNFSKLPSHRIATGYSLPESEADPTWKSRLSHTQRQQLKSMNPVLSCAAANEQTIRNLYATTSITDTTNLRGGTATDHHKHSSLVHKLPPPLVDSIEVVSAGVIVREAGLVKRGPRQSASGADDTSNLRPMVGVSPPGRILTAKDILSNSPIIRPLQTHFKSPLPAISPQCN